MHLVTPLRTDRVTNSGSSLINSQIWTNDAYAVRQPASRHLPRSSSMSSVRSSPAAANRIASLPSPRRRAADRCAWVIPAELGKHRRNAFLDLPTPVVGVLGLDRQTDRHMVLPGVSDHDHQFPQGNQLTLLRFGIGHGPRAEIHKLELLDRALTPVLSW